MYILQTERWHLRKSCLLLVSSPAAILRGHSRWEFAFFCAAIRFLRFGFSPDLRSFNLSNSPHRQRLLLLFCCASVALRWLFKWLFSVSRLHLRLQGAAAKVSVEFSVSLIESFKLRLFNHQESQSITSCTSRYLHPLEISLLPSSSGTSLGDQSPDLKDLSLSCN